MFSSPGEGKEYCFLPSFNHNVLRKTSLTKSSVLLALYKLIDRCSPEVAGWPESRASSNPCLIAKASFVEAESSEQEERRTDGLSVNHPRKSFSSARWDHTGDSKRTLAASITRSTNWAGTRAIISPDFQQLCFRDPWTASPPPPLASSLPTSQIWPFEMEQGEQDYRFQTNFNHRRLPGAFQKDVWHQIQPQKRLFRKVLMKRFHL